MARSNMTRLCTRSLAKLLLKTNHRIKGLTVGKKHLKAEKQPLWLVAAIRRTIVDLPGGYEEAAEILVCTRPMMSRHLLTLCTIAFAMVATKYSLSGGRFFSRVQAALTMLPMR
jgi:hypothetical protein